MKIFQRLQNFKNINKKKEINVDPHTQFVRNVSHRMGIQSMNNESHNSIHPCDIMGGDIPKFVQELFSIGNEYNRKLKKIVEYSSMVNGEFVSIEGPLLVRNLISNAIANVKDRVALFSDNDPVVNVVIDARVPVSELIGDGPAVTRILEELLYNGIRHSSDDEVSIHIFPDIYEGGDIYFSIQNTGIVIPQDEILSTFEPFKTISTSEGVVMNKGVGIGLATCKEMSKILKGKLDVKSGKETIFTLVVPFKHSKELKFNTRSLEINHERSNILSNSITKYDSDECIKLSDISVNVLVVDDSLLILKMFDKMLTKIGVYMEGCTEPLVALNKVKDKKYDVIFLDVVMPIMNGITCAHEIRNGNNINKNTPIIIVTADMTTETRQLTTYISDSLLLEKPARSSVVTMSLISLIEDEEKKEYLRNQ